MSTLIVSGPKETLDLLEKNLIECLTNPELTVTLSNPGYSQQLTQEAFGQISFTIQFDKSVGSLCAEDAYLKALTAITNAIQQCQAKVCLFWLEKFKALVEQRIKEIDALKEQNPKQYSDLVSAPKLHKWVQNYKKMQANVPENIDKQKAKALKNKHSLQWEQKQKSFLPSLDKPLSVEKNGTLSRKIEEHFSTLRPASMNLTAQSQNFKKVQGTLRIKRKGTETEQLAFTIWWQKREKDFTFSQDLLDTYEASLRCILFPAPTILCKFKPETLIEQLRAVFRIDVPKHEEIVLKIQEYFGTNTSSVIVISQELETRLKMLDQHPYYTARSFKNQQAFQFWKEREEKNIKQLMQKMGMKEDKYVHRTTNHRQKITSPAFFQSPSTGKGVELPSSKTIDFHKAYLQLFTLLIKYESLKNSTQNTIRNGVPIQIASLGEHWNWLTDQYGIKYGVDELYRRLVHLDILAQSFAHTKHHLVLLQDCLFGIINYLKTDYIITNHETSIISIALEILYGQIRNRIANFSECFAKSLSDLSLILKVLETITVLDNTIFVHSEPVSVKKIIQECVVKAATLEYQNIVVRTEKTLETSQVDSATLKLTEEMLVVISSLILDTLENNLTVYIDSFKPYVNLPSITAQVYYESYIQELRLFCNPLSKLESNYVVGTSFFEMAAKFAELSQACFKRNPSLVLVPYSELFESAMLKWIQQISNRLLEWTKEACKLDKWEAIDTESLFSSSVVDLFSVCYAPLKVIQDYSFLQGENKFMNIFGKVIKKMIVEYINIVLNESSKDISGELKEKLNKFLENMGTRASDKNPIQRRRGLTAANFLKRLKLKKSSNLDLPTYFSSNITKQMCIYVNNIETCRLKLGDLHDELGEQLGESIDESFKLLREFELKAMGVLLFRINGTFVNKIKKLLKVSPKDQTSFRAILQEILEYLDSQLEVLADNLYPGLLTKMVKLIWECLMNSLIDIILPGDASKYISANQALYLQDILDPLVRFFHAGGSGLSKLFLERYCGFIRGIIALFQVDTQSLIELYTIYQTSSKSIPNIESRADLVITAHHIFNLLSGRTDKTAQKFVKTLLDK